MALVKHQGNSSSDNGPDSSKFEGINLAPLSSQELSVLFSTIPVVLSEEEHLNSSIGAGKYLHQCTTTHAHPGIQQVQAQLDTEAAAYRNSKPLFSQISSKQVTQPGYAKGEDTVTVEDIDQSDAELNFSSTHDSATSPDTLSVQLHNEKSARPSAENVATKRFIEQTPNSAKLSVRMDQGHGDGFQEFVGMIELVQQVGNVALVGTNSEAEDIPTATDGSMGEHMTVLKGNRVNIHHETTTAATSLRTKVLDFQLDVQTRVYSPVQSRKNRRNRLVGAASIPPDAMVLQARVNLRHPRLLQLFRTMAPSSEYSVGSSHDKIKLQKPSSQEAGHLPENCNVTKELPDKNTCITAAMATCAVEAISSKMPKGQKYGTIAAARGTQSLVRRKNVLTVDLCDPALQRVLVEFFELYNKFADAGTNVSDAACPILLIFVDLSEGKVETQRALVWHVGLILERLSHHTNPLMRLASRNVLINNPMVRIDRMGLKESNQVFRSALRSSTVTGIRFLRFLTGRLDSFRSSVCLPDTRISPKTKAISRSRQRLKYQSLGLDDVKAPTGIQSTAAGLLQ